MKANGTRRDIFLFCLILSLACSASCATANRDADNAQDYKIIHKVISQPADHADPSGPTLDQHVDILIPDGVPPNAPVFFHFGNETDLTDEHLLRLFRLHGKGFRIIYVQAEHRGYGQSLTQGEDQSVPSYVRVEQALADAHEVAQELKKEYPGPWMVAGWSYGGALVLEFAAKYPDDVEVILCSSGVVDWPFLDYGYDRQVRKTLGDACYKRLARHSKNLEPVELFDANWTEREFLHATIMGVTQFPRLKRLKPAFQMLSFLPTRSFLRVMHRMDNQFGDGEAWRYAQASSARKVAANEVAEGIHNWHAWRYQMCAEIGGFLASEDPEGLFIRKHDDFCEECRELFGEDPPSAVGEWSQRKLLESLAIPIIYVTGGMDPWLSVSVQPDYKIKNGKYFFVPEGRHCPDRDDPELARKILAEMLKRIDGK
ncbi:alpha/beta fold hydrolase [Candidatus Poribacteria bacterium]|nr:alpha/beta fold hydrolase [Candidatus Poribacteria bacterium]